MKEELLIIKLFEILRSKFFELELIVFSFNYINYIASLMIYIKKRLFFYNTISLKY